jgi:hypothetical protein
MLGPPVTVMYYQSYLRATRPDLYPPLDPLFLATANDLSPVLLPTRPHTLLTPQPTTQHPASVTLVHPAQPPTPASKRLRPTAYVSDTPISDPNVALSNRVHIIFLGTEGYLYRPIDLILTYTLQIPLAPANRLLAALHRHALYYLHTLIRHRRALDFSPSDVSTPPPHRNQDPP